MATAIISPEIYTDLQGLQNLKRAAREDEAGAAKEVAKQFESIFVKMMLKSMREASFGDEIFGSQQMDAYQDMYDNQMAVHLSSGKGIGLADVIVRQISAGQSEQVPHKKIETFELNRKNDGIPLEKITNNEIKKTIREYIHSNKLNVSKVEKPAYEAEVAQTAFSSPAEFIEILLPLAKKASEESGISAKMLIAQAALETGWGKAISKHADGKSSFNLFNIKADHRWDGDRVTKTTVEFDNGIANKQKASFRSYDSLEASFDDFVNYVSTEPRYQSAMAVVSDNNGFITELHNSGYATDPRYAEKVIRVLNGIEMKNVLIGRF